MDLFAASLLVGLLVTLTRRRLVALASPRQKRTVKVATAFAATTSFALALLSLPSAAVSLSQEGGQLDLRRAAETLTPASPAPLGGGLTLTEVSAEGPSGLLFRCSASPPLDKPLSELLEELRIALEESPPTQELVSMGVSLTYRVVDPKGTVLGEVVVPSR